MVIFISIGNNCNELSQMKNNGIIAHDIKKSKETDCPVRGMRVEAGHGLNSAGAKAHSKKPVKTSCSFYSIKTDREMSMQ
ncbi:MAG: hypothetical protein L3J84_10465 [Gammaproteobacteria bacterium]|nr:hypothetical protein [Gammaproteobacteria bacterium]